MKVIKTWWLKRKGKKYIERYARWIRTQNSLDNPDFRNYLDRKEASKDKHQKYLERLEARKVTMERIRKLLVSILWLMIIGCAIFAVYWIGKAIIGFIKLNRRVEGSEESKGQVYLFSIFLFHGESCLLR